MRKIIGLTLTLFVCIQGRSENSSSASMISSKDDIYYVTRAANNSYLDMQIHPRQLSNFSTSIVHTGDGGATFQSGVTDPEYKIWLPLVENSHIYYVAITGNDANPGTLSQPWRTILKVTKSLKSGDTAVVLSGIYDEQVNISTSGITLQADGKVITKGITIYGNSNTIRGFTITDPTSDAGIFVRGGNYNLIENNEIYHTRQDGIWFFGSFNTFRGNSIHNILDPSMPITHTDCFQTWGWDWDTTNDLFEKNICLNDAKNGSGQIVELERSTAAEVRDITFRNNVLVIYSPTFAALNFSWSTGYPQVSNITVENNTIVNMSRRRAEGIEFENVAGATAINNLFINFGNAAYTPYIGIEGGSNINIHNNAVYNTDGIPPQGGPYPGDVWMQDPLVVNINGLDFHLRSNSPLIDAGDNLGNLVPDDFDGIIRPQGAGFDIGAYEFPAP